ncbi:MAG: hypothetical protein A2X34_02595 [Elusimicrobia bacterium GWC2_51_8]|nr:MAG: hypothetical protein A2X33_06860 [Elusimicrobia bacterium GWA2_51_34]OGR61346.1 MAG: hypothetical protein A2X34_02595 [Elusimicrobia bacterium GWC2_51_8]OGR88589.1 MAG: hypothetical protein A2021_09975 [Elusimicrobia bacterium GWF2_52_66]HAF95447.1 hypothetical protein [Elusimicrobiota bacterium]HCE98109.1 hypothetical protein [Elusimicrobiota bacterium]
MRESTGLNKFSTEKTALVAVLRSPRDLEMAARRRWYRIPVKKAPKRRFTHIAFYQPACFKPDGKRIVYYAEVAGCRTERRIDIFPDEPGHPAARELYFKYSLGPLIKLPLPVLNTSRSRVSFGYASLKSLSRARDILGIFNTFPIENIMCDALKSAGFNFYREYIIMRGRKTRYRLDFALLRKNGKLDIECDGYNWHSARAQRVKDAKRDKWLRSHGWTILRFGEHAVVNNLEDCIGKINTAVQLIGQYGRAAG